LSDQTGKIGPPESGPVAVIGLGASAPAFRSLERLFALIPRDSDAAFVIVSESTHPLDTDALVATLNAHGGPQARIAADGDRLAPNQIHVAPAGVMVTLEDGKLRLSQPEQRSGHRGTVDAFLLSLAEQRRNAAIGIILAAVKAAGSLGIARLKECGGLTIVEAEPEHPEPDPQDIDGAAGMADIRVPLEEIPVRLQRLIEHLLESTRIATLFLDNDLRVKSFTPSLSEVFHLTDSDLGRPIAHIAARLPYPDLAEDVRRVLRTLTNVEREIGTPEGGRYLARVLPYRSVDNFIAGAVITLLDITAATVAQAAQQAAEERTRLATTAARIAIWELDVESRQSTHSEGFETAFNIPPPPALPALLARTAAEDRHRLSTAFHAAIEECGTLDVEVRMNGLRGEVWVRFSGSRNGGKLLGVLQNVDERRRAEAQQNLLMAELQHRVKNILGVVRSLTARSLESSTNLAEFAARFPGRIDALARTQSMMANRGTGGIRLDELIRDELEASTGNGNDRVVIGGPPILLKDKAAETFALGIHELTSNAVKYGALSTKEGQLTVRWGVTNTSNGARLALTWQEHGVRMPDKPPARTGFGRRLIERALPYDLDAATALEFGLDGVRCTVELPLGRHVIAWEQDAMEPVGRGRETAA
jgi:two-component sensor histidine kinase